MIDQGRRFVSPDEVETQVFDWGAIKWLSEPRVTNAQNFSTGVVLLAPGKGHTRHNHPAVEEILYVVSGQGTQMVENEQGEPVRQTIIAGMLVHIPADVYHETINTGWEPLKLIAIYSPHGPEALLRAMPECRVVPPGQLASG
ncbi:MAG TPA: cupin domain-containing protein [Chloroflexota bacterium]|nr:cupin domain-containing protein [Chloroflexota bacterium]